MTSRKDQAEAHAFSRRRVATAFTSGAPGGREVEPRRPGRTVVAGVAVALLLVAGAAVAGVLGAGGDDVDWDAELLVTERETGALFVNLDPAGGEGDPVLRQVANLTSARLLLGPGVEPVVVSREEITDRSRRGATVGILGAPQTPPAVSDLVGTGWTGCAAGEPGGDPADAATRLRLAQRPDVTPVPDRAVLVSTRDDYWLVAESTAGGATPRATAYEVPDVAGADTLLADLAGLSRADALPVTAGWLDLFPRGGSLTADGLGLDGFGTPVDATGLPGVPRVGDVVETPDGAVLVLTGTGLMRLDAFGAAVYRNVPLPGGVEVRTYDVDRPPPTLDQRDTEAYAANGWPRDVVAPADPATLGEPCALLETAPGAEPVVRLASASGGPASAAEVAPGGTVASVEPGRGALVGAPRREGEAEAEDGPVATLVDDLGRTHPVADEAALTNLGYAAADAVPVPPGWLALLTTGDMLSVEAARCPPTTDAPTTTGCTG